MLTVWEEQLRVREVPQWQLPHDYCESQMQIPLLWHAGAEKRETGRWQDLQVLGQIPQCLLPVLLDTDIQSIHLPFVRGVEPWRTHSVKKMALKVESCRPAGRGSVVSKNGFNK
ncbi:hypothetical protein CHARACLAT_012056 [Characodon lateralis]|uniref:Uncharacterized protein n=1 Tax=Characodon lateralis TaxID=208331 RepID=A0ABU7EID1_9TELE|nr:hypothetical protein [Characodon lateralis]